MIRPLSKTAALAATLVLALTVVARADDKAAIGKVKAHYQAAAAAYDDGDLEKTEAELQKALKLAEENGLASQKVVAQTYLLYGVLEVAGLKNRDQGVKYFVKAIDISPAISVPPTMASKAVLAAFERAENKAGEQADTPAESAPAEEAPPPKQAEREKPQKPEKRAKETRAERDPDKDKLVDDLAAAKVNESLQQAEKEKLLKEKQEQDQELAGAKGHYKELAKEKADTEKQLADAKLKIHDLEREKQERDKQLADVKAKLQDLTKEKQDTDKQLTASQAADSKGREASNKLAHDKSEIERQKTELEHQVADEKRNLQDMAKEKAAVDAQLAKLKVDAEKQITAAHEETRREREAKEKLATGKADADRQLADEKRNLADLTKQKAEVDKQLAAALGDAKSQREAKEKLAAARKESDAREAERKSKEQQDRAAHEKLVEGPDLPSHITEPIACTVPDEVPPGADLYVHCVPRPNLEAKVVALYYRAGGLVYNASTMEKSRKGWYTALIPGGKISGKVLQYYVEARNGRQDVVGSNGRSSSPNIAAIRPAKSR
jgi:hypothetical protein